MYNKKLTPILSFLLTVVLAFSLFSPGDAFAASTVTQQWSFEYKGEPLFDPIQQKDGSLLVGKYDIVNGVYQTDLMTIDKKGKKKSGWSLKGERGQQIYTGGSATVPLIYSINYELGKITVYDKNGKIKSTINRKQWIEPVYFDEKGYIYVSNEEKIFGYSPEGKIVSTFNLPSVKYDDYTNYYSPYNIKFLPDRSFYFIHSYQGDPNQGKLVKYSAAGKEVWGQNSIKLEKDYKYLTNVSILLTDNKNITYTLASFMDEKDPNNYDDDKFYSKIFAIDSKGKLVWKKTFNYEINTLNVQKLKDNLSILTYEKNIVLNSKGVILNEQTVGAVFDYTKLTNDQLSILTDRHILLFDANGKQLWKKAITKNNESETDYLQFTNNVKDLMFYRPDKNQLSSYDLKGALKWNYFVDKKGFIQAAVVNESTKTIFVQHKTVVESKDDYSFKTKIIALKYK